MARHIVNGDDIAAPPANLSRQDLLVPLFFSRANPARRTVVLYKLP